MEEHGAENFALLRRLALATLQRDSTCKLGARNKRFRASFDPAYRLRLIRLIVNRDAIAFDER